ncbi:hypothetical protein OIO90_002214 [Microbotryomycetes sp. JL221]|nr:hypothetical protein OIO90_002214 [Microbotryomycetes sp. JL221]
MASSSSNRWSRIGLAGAATSTSSSSASLTAPDQISASIDSRRLSRVSQADFDSLLHSDETIVIPRSVDESELGKATLDTMIESSPELDRKTAPPSPLVTTDLAPRDVSSRSKSLSVPPTPAKDALNGTQTSLSSTQQRRSSDYSTTSPIRSSLATRKTSLSNSNVVPPSTTTERKSSAFGSFQPPPALAPSPNPQQHVSSQDVRSQTSAQSLAARKVSTGSTTNASLSSYSWTSNNASTDSSSKRQTQLQPDIDRSKGTLASTMRRTSRFFRKFGGGGGAGSLSADNRSTEESSKGLGSTPIADTFSTSTTPQPKQASVMNSRPSITPNTFEPLDTSKTSYSDASDAKRRASSTTTANKGENPMVPPKSPSMTRLNSITRSLSSTSSLDGKDQANGASTPIKMTVPGYGPTPQKQQLTASTTMSSMASSRTPGSQRGEEEQLRRELRRWQLDGDGVLGVGNGAPGSTGTSSRGTSMPPTPMSKADFFRSSSSLSSSNKSTPRRPSFQAERTSVGSSTSQDPAYEALILQQRSLSLPGTSRHNENLSPGDQTEELREDEFASRDSFNPKKELPPPPADTTPPDPLSGDGAHQIENEEPRRPSTTSQMTIGSKDGESQTTTTIHSVSGIGLGLGPVDPEKGSESVPTSQHELVGSKAQAAEAPGSAEAVPAPVINIDENTPSIASSTFAVPRTSLSAYPSSSNRRSVANRQSVVTFPIGESSNFASSQPRQSAQMRSGRREFDILLPGEDEHSRLEPVDVRAQKLAQRIWEEDPTLMDAKKVATWLGSPDALNSLTLRNWIEHFDFAGLRLDVAFRRLCSKLYLKAETQQVDRILAQFSRQFDNNNPQSVYGSADVVHAVSYSLLLLNTDLHVVDSTTRMSRQQFIKNTVAAIQAQHEVSADDTLDQDDIKTSPALLFKGGQGLTNDNVFGPVETMSRRAPSPSSTTDGTRRLKHEPSLSSIADASPSKAADDTPSSSPILDRRMSSKPTDSPRVAASLSAPAMTSTTTLDSDLANSQVTGVANPKLQEAKLEIVLKDMYNAIKQHPIFQPSDSKSASTSRTSLSLTAGGANDSTGQGSTSHYGTLNGINRAASRRSVASSNGPQSMTTSTNKRASIRGFGVLLGSGSGTHSSLDVFRPPSPSPSTATSFTDDQFSTAYGASSSTSSDTTSPFHQVPTIGFAKNLSHTIIREQQEDELANLAALQTSNNDNTTSTTTVIGAGDEDDMIEITDEELALMGAPWAKEGLVWRKHYWEMTGKRSKDKHWLQVFVVAGSGSLQMFRFDGAGGGGNSRGSRMGGGDWTSNANSVGAISLIHALCSAMPPPGYNKSRPHCFVLTLPSGGTYFFQTGTPDLVSEWVSTCNYWSARLSKTSLPGGVSNMEYGWNKVDAESLPIAIDVDRRHSIAVTHKHSSSFDRILSGGSSGMHGAASSIADDAMSMRSGKSKRSYQVSLAQSSTSAGAGALGAGHSSGSVAINDKMFISDWQPPPPPSGASQLSEDAQLDNLKKHLALVKQELLQHNMLRAPLTKLYSPRSANLAKASTNWERKSRHLVAETVKFQTYIDALASAIQQRSLKRGQKQVELMLKDADENLELNEHDEREVSTPVESVPVDHLETAQNQNRDDVGEEESVRFVGAATEESSPDVSHADHDDTKVAKEDDTGSGESEVRESVYLDASDVSPVVA